jgi:hypothetical protein
VGIPVKETAPASAANVRVVWKKVGVFMISGA